MAAPELRHFNVSIGHAVSHDLVSWEFLPDALHPDSRENWDDFTTWTGSIIKHDNLWYMFYTGTNRAEKGLIQRIGLATSKDLHHWEKHSGNPIIEVNPQWYETLEMDSWHDQTWRDPWVFYAEEDQHFHVYITARVNYGPKDKRGVIGHAKSGNLIDWQVLPPVSAPGSFGFLEVPQLLSLNGKYMMLFSSEIEYQAQTWKARWKGKVQTGTHYLVADNPFGPFRLTSDLFMIGDAQGSLYSGKIIQNNRGDWVFLAFHNYGKDGSFIGIISEPMPVYFNSDGRIQVKAIEK